MKDKENSLMGIKFPLLSVCPDFEISLSSLLSKNMRKISQCNAIY